MISRSPQRGSFHIDNQLQRVESGETSAEAAEEMIDFYRTHNDLKLAREESDEFKQNNMEYDLRTCEWMLAKVRGSEAYAQNLYAAICNNDFQKNDVWPQLKGDTWSASWRYAGGIIADMRQEGDYIDWYCSGITSNWSDEEFAEATKENQERYLYLKNNYVGESYVTDEIREDLFKLGWLVVDSKDE